VVVGIGLVLVVVNVGLLLLDGATRGADESGARSSSFSTGRDGTAGYAALLRHYGHDVERARGTLRAGELDPRATVVVLDAFPDDREARAVATFVRAGGRLVAGGPDAAEWVRDLAVDSPRWAMGGARAVEVTIGDARYRVRTGQEGQWRSEQDPLLVDATTGDGATLLLSDASPLSNARLDQADNAAFGLALAGDPARPVSFVEGPHGYGDASGLDAIPWRWKVALVLGILAALLALVAGTRRIGPAEERARALAPPRRAYVDALGVALARARRPAEAVAPLQAAARDLLATRAGLPTGASDDEVRDAARRAGWSDPEIEALFAPTSDDESIVRAGRALARAEKETST